MCKALLMENVDWQPLPPELGVAEDSALARRANSRCVRLTASRGLMKAGGGLCVSVCMLTPTTPLTKKIKTDPPTGTSASFCSTRPR